MILVLDYGSQYTQLIARRVREAKVFSLIQPYNAKLRKEDYPDLKGVILSGGPASVYADQTLGMNQDVMALGVPVLGICYGAQLLVKEAGGRVASADKREYGRAMLEILDRNDLFCGVEAEQINVWMSHGDKIEGITETFESIGRSNNSPYAAIRKRGESVFGVQFHPEVYHTECGAQILGNFVHRVCGAEGNWTSEAFVEESIDAIRKQVGDDGHVICGVSGGVDSSVLAVLLTRAIGDRARCVFVDTGLLRQDEAEEVRCMLRDHLGVNLQVEDATELFLDKLRGVTDPEQKRKITGRTFIEVFERIAKQHQDAGFLAQGTLYPDLIESISHVGPSATIKSHHNVGGLPETMQLELIEPLRELFKDEVRKVGRALEIPDVVLSRHPFPGPGLVVRVIGEITAQRLDVLRQADAIFIEELRTWELYDKVWQAFAVFLPVKTVGVMGDARTYENAVALRAVESTDGMTADWAPLPADFLSHVATRIINEVKGINRVVYDISSKPPGTIEWE